MGEYVAACLAGVLSLEDALRLIATRAQLVNALPQGAMLAVTLAEDELLSILPDGLSISLINGPQLCVVAGPPDGVACFEKTLEKRGVIARRVQNGHAFHSSMLDSIVPVLETEVRKAHLSEPTVPYISNVTGTWITAGEATNPAYWGMHATRTARFSDALREVWRFENPILVEAGPGRTLSVLAMQHPDREGADAVPVSSIRHEYDHQDDCEYLCHGIGRVWVSGAEITWDEMPASASRRRVPAPDISVRTAVALARSGSGVDVGSAFPVRRSAKREGGSRTVVNAPVRTQEPEPVRMAVCAFVEASAAAGARRYRHSSGSECGHMARIRRRVGRRGRIHRKTRECGT
jgi:acyl transferase domain-containing protein